MKNGHQVSSDNTATCKLLTFSFEWGRISFPWPRSRAGWKCSRVKFSTRARGCPPLQ